MTNRTWHSTATAAEYGGCHVVTVLKALEAGELHGAQRKPKGRWRIHVDCLDAWLAGEKCQHAGRKAS
jgi:excisionase family DNA binding protein